MITSKITMPMIQAIIEPVDIEGAGALLSIVDIDGFDDMDEFPAEPVGLSGS